MQIDALGILIIVFHTVFKLQLLQNDAAPSPVPQHWLKVSI
jgi:hypothetical protein